jgi:lysophospholipase L1-like esterase
MVITFGDSTTARRDGVDVYTDRLSRRFSVESPDFRFVNCGVPGNTTSDARQRFANEVLALAPKVVVIQFGINDSAVDVWKSPPALHARVPLPEYEENLRFFEREIRRASGRVILMSPNPLRWSSETKALYRSRPYDPTHELGFSIVLRPYVEVVRSLSIELQIPLVDVFSLYEEWERSNQRSCSDLMLDGMHPNSLGQALVADALTPLLVELLSTKI